MFPEYPRLRASLVIRRSTIESFLLASLLFAAVCADYLWIGPAPLWLEIVGLGGLYALVARGRLARLVDQVRGLVVPVCAPWLLFVAVVLVGDWLNGSLAASVSRMVVLNLAALLLLLTAAAWSSNIDRRQLLTIIAVLGFMQGLVGIAQFLDVPGAWDLPAAIQHLGSRAGDALQSLGDFDDVGRVRGLHIYVHKFSAIQGMFVACLAAATLSGRRVLRQTRLVFVLFAAATTVAVVCLLLTFTRSVLLGLGLALMVASLALPKKQRGVAVVVICGAAATVALMAVALDIASSPQFGRLMDYSAADNAGRLEVWAYALEAFRRSPLIGEGFATGSKYLPIAIHSVFLHILASYGILGALAYALVVGGCALLFFRALRSQDAAVKLSGATGLAVLIVALIDGSTHSSGMLVADVGQPALIGALLGQVIRVTDRRGDPPPVLTQV